jgi:hypothetical protein
MGLCSGGKRRRYYVCRDRDRVHGKYRCHRVSRVEQQFVALLDRLVASPELVGVIVDRGGVAEEQRGLAARLTDLRQEAADASARRERVREAFESGSLRRDTVQQRLDDLTAREKDARAAIVRTEVELAAMKARAASVDEAQGLVAMTRRVLDHAAVPDRKALARALSDALGGLVVTEGAAYRGRSRRGGAISRRLSGSRLEGHEKGAMEQEGQQAGESVPHDIVFKLTDGTTVRETFASEKEATDALTWLNRALAGDPRRNVATHTGKTVIARNHFKSAQVQAVVDYTATEDE